MRVLEHLAVLAQWRAAGRRGALATLVAVERSAPRDPGASMAICEDGELCGSISGGCVEAALADEARLLFRDGRARLRSYGVSDSQAQAVGLSCGGTLEIFVDEPAPALIAQVHGAMREGRHPLGAALRIDEAQPARLAVFERRSFGSLGNRELDEAVGSDICAGAASQEACVRQYGEEGEPHGDVRVFIHLLRPRPRMYVFGAIDFAAAMLDVAKLLGYEAVLCDARSAFATPDRFPRADRIAVAWPDDFLRSEPVDESSAIVAMTHDEKFDIPLIRAALETRAGYIGIMGSRRTNERRFTQLREAGVTEDQLARLSAPIGLNLGARTPEETAIAIAAEIVALRHGRDGGRLTGGSGSLRGSP